ncbi:hypothetical protein DL95DRAFT_413010 [Leptodontidium sp. 2 PMI_412]|nr:hypothetical protein DL95DRAFT_413010 [Leptodontidium sp. 2 PMI_412]
MSGFEAAGLVLGILLLLISAAEHYDDVLRPFKRYKKFAHELEIYRLELGAQKAIFCNECHILLGSLTNHQTAGEMLREPRSPSWQNEQLDERLGQQLGDSGMACKTIILLIQSKLDVIEAEAAKFDLGD